jgi:alkylation response protein AidB-like acyl-CoA dehydrogenase
MDFPLSDRMLDLIARAQPLAAGFAERAPAHDRSGDFAFENFADLRAAGFPALNAPRRYGGEELTLPETVVVLETLATGDGSTALCFAMHAQTLGAAVESGAWPPELLERLCRMVVGRGALINAVASEPELGSPSRGGKPRTTASPVMDASGQLTAWRLEGRKTWASMSPVLDVMIVPAALMDGSEQAGRFLVPMGEGIEIAETWDSMGMRSTGSHDVLLKGVQVPVDHLIERETLSAPSKGGLANGWFLLCVSAVYLGVAQAALDTATEFARQRVPTALGKPIAEVEAIQRRIGRAEHLIQQGRLTVHQAAQLWQSRPDVRVDLGGLVSVAKVTATNNAVEAVDECMRVAGGSAMSRSLPLERLYRDVRAGLSHPVNDDAAFIQLGRRALVRAGSIVRAG